MLIFSPKRMYCTLFTFIVLQISVIQVESTLSSTAAKVRRTQSISPVRTGSASQSTSSIVSHNVQLKPKASTSAIQQDVEQRPLMERETKQVRFTGSESLTDPMAVTYGEHLDPRRDGVFARMRTLQHVPTAVVGTLSGAGLVVAKQILFQNNTTTNEYNTNQ